MYVSDYFIQHERFVLLKNGHWDPQIQIKNSNFGRETIYYSKIYKVRKSMQFKKFLVPLNFIYVKESILTSAT